MRGTNTLIINPEEMRRAVDLYLKALLNWNEYESVRVRSVKQLGAGGDFEIIIDPYPQPAPQKPAPESEPE